jgi:peptidyl-prolyl cis-trans isomerase A (cyclophilin A)
MRRALVLLGVLAAAGCGGGGGGGSSTSQALLHPDRLTARAPATFDVTLRTTRGDVVVAVDRAWAPHGADRFYELVTNHFYDGVKFFRVVPGFVVQFGISPDPAVAQAWQDAAIPDDPVRRHNTRGTLSFASAGPDTRTTQVFVNLADNRSLDGMGFAPFGVVTSGMDVLDSLYSGYGDAPTSHQGEMTAEGDAYLRRAWPKLDALESTRTG